MYYAWRTYSELQPQKYVCIIHDKMDQKKTAIPRLQTLPKEIDSTWQLQVALIGMITHGHGEEELWPFYIKWFMDIRPQPHNWINCILLA